MSDHLETYIEPELEARITAMVLGEASAFEIEELERLIESRPELRLFHQRMAAVHGLLRETGKGEIETDEQWTLPGDKRKALLEAFDDTPEKSPPVEIKKKFRKENKTMRWLPAVATIALLLATVSILSFPSYNRVRSVAEVKAGRTNPIHGSVKPEQSVTLAPYVGYNGTPDTWYQNDTRVDSDFDANNREATWLWDYTDSFEMAANGVIPKNRPTSGLEKNAEDGFKENVPGGSDYKGRSMQTYTSDEPHPVPNPPSPGLPKLKVDDYRNWEGRKDSEIAVSRGPGWSGSLNFGAGFSSIDRVESFEFRPDDTEYGLSLKNLDGGSGHFGGGGGIGGGGIAKGPGRMGNKEILESGKPVSDSKPGKESTDSPAKLFARPGGSTREEDQVPGVDTGASRDLGLSFPTGENEKDRIPFDVTFENRDNFFIPREGKETYHRTPEPPKKIPTLRFSGLSGEANDANEPDMPILREVGGVAISGEGESSIAYGKSIERRWAREKPDNTTATGGYFQNGKAAQSDQADDGKAIPGRQRYESGFGVVKEGRGVSDLQEELVSSGVEERQKSESTSGSDSPRGENNSFWVIPSEHAQKYHNSESKRLSELDTELGSRRIDELKVTDEEQREFAAKTVSDALSRLGATLDYTKTAGEEDDKNSRSERHYIDEIHIAGNTKTKDHVIRRELGRPLNKSRTTSSPPDLLPHAYKFDDGEPGEIEKLREVEELRTQTAETRTRIRKVETEIEKKKEEGTGDEIESLDPFNLTNDLKALRRDQDAIALDGTYLHHKRFKTHPPVKEKEAAVESFSTFSLHVSDVSFKLAYAALAKGEWPDPSRIRIEEFVNAFDYEDPIPSQLERVSSTIEQTIHPTMQQRNLLRIAMRTAESGRSASVPLNLTFLIDSSGSMERFDRQDTLQRAFSLLANQLQESDKVTLISFARQPRLLAEAIPGNQANKLIKIVSQLPEEGGTNLEGALNLALQKGKDHRKENSQNRIILLTDGAANLGDANPERLAGIIGKMRASGIAFDAAGIGADGLNDEILEALTRKGDGRYYLLDRPEQADAKFARQIAGALRPAAMNVKVQVEFNPLRVGRYQLHGFEKHRLKKEDFRNDKVDAAEMSAAEAGVALYQYEPLPDGTGDVGSVSVRFKDMFTGRMVEKCWPIPYQASMARLDNASETIRLATAATLTASKLKGEPLGARSEWDDISKLLGTLSPKTREQERVKQLSEIVNQARAIQ